MLIIVIRYFGGILLGTGGLVRAYSESLQEAIKKTQIIEKCEGEEVLLKLEYGEFEKLKYYCEKAKINIADVKYLENIECKVEILENHLEQLLKELEQKNIKIMENKLICKKFITLL